MCMYIYTYMYKYIYSCIFQNSKAVIQLVTSRSEIILLIATKMADSARLTRISIGWLQGIIYQWHSEPNTYWMCQWYLKFILYFNSNTDAKFLLKKTHLKYLHLIPGTIELFISLFIWNVLWYKWFS